MKDFYDLETDEFHIELSQVGGKILLFVADRTLHGDVPPAMPSLTIDQALDLAERIKEYISDTFPRAYRDYLNRP